MSVGWALSWELWARQRWVLWWSAAYLVLVIVLARLLPDRVSPEVIAWLLTPVLGVLPVLVAGMCRGLEGKFEGPGSLLPGRLLVLPLSARALVTWSMLAGAVPISLLWPLLALGLRWLGESAPLLWPALVVFNVVAWLQTLSYLPFGVPYLRLWAAGVLVPCLVGAPCLLAELGVPEWLLAVLLLGLGLGAFRLAVLGVEQARKGVGSSWEGWWARPLSPGPPVKARPFAGPLQALFWLQWRLDRGKILFGAVLALGLMMPFLYLATRVLEDSQLVEAAGLGPAVRAVGPGWLALAGLFWAPFLLGAIGCDTSQSHAATRRVSASFVLVRPVSTGTLVAGKLWMCAFTALLGVLLLLPAWLGWAWPTGRWVEMRDRLITLSGSGWAAGLIFVSGLAALFAITWGQTAAGLWVGLTGRMWVVSVAVGVWMAEFAGLSLLVTQLLKEPAWRVETARLLPSVMAWAFLFKIVLAIVVYAANVWRGLLAPRTVLLVLAVWLVAAVMLFAELAWLVPVETVARVNLALGVAVVLPIARIGLAPLAVAWNRRR